MKKSHDRKECEDKSPFIKVTSDQGDNQSWVASSTSENSDPSLDASLSVKETLDTLAETQQQLTEAKQKQAEAEERERDAADKLFETQARLTQIEEQQKKNPQSALGGNIEKLRLECGWSFDDLQEVTGLNKKLIIGHSIKGKGARPFTLKLYADAFSKQLKRTITVNDLLS